ncbi:MAG: hypothetical protein LBB61_00110 [Treponema sp.]|nr:hypothetical protein [Treponema sp.]
MAGFDDISLARFDAAALTTVHQSLDELGREAALMLKNSIEKPVSSTLIFYLPFSLIPLV